MKSRLVKALLLIAFILAVLAAFIFGTIVGFSTATKNLENCEVVPCSALGVDMNATRCELCEGVGLFRLSR